MSAIQMPTNKTMMWRLSITLVLICSMASACQGIGDEIGPGAMRFIIKFNAFVTDPANPAILESLSRDAGVVLEYVRPMSGGAHVFAARRSAGLESREIIRRLSQRDDILYVEEDIMLRHQKPAANQ